ncbi:MAG: aspartate aminotransferase family protein [Christensenellaceae bacterium]|jgi:aminotransferase, acetylornithine/succinylornithine family|nr:aspartate aminotransferase family protein [Christensenellaceae bacterium]
MKLDKIMELDKQYYMNTFGSRTPICFEYGKGSTLYDTSGRAYTDFLGGIAVNCLGYGDQGLIDAISGQAAKIIHCSNLFYIENQAELARELNGLSGGYKCFFCNSGAEANEGAFKLARKYFYARGQDRYEIISAKNSFHGRTMAALAATGQEKYQLPYSPLPAGFINVQYNSIEAIKEALTPHTAAVMLETIQGESGVIEGTPQYLEAVSDLCKKEGLLLIIDEVQTGMGRTGVMFSFQRYNLKPDIFTLAKGLGGGVPIGAVLALPGVSDAFAPGDHGTTFGGNPLACAAALYITGRLDENMLKQVTQKGEYLKSRLAGLAQKFSFIKEIRGKGLLTGMELDNGVPGREIVSKALEKGFILNCAGHNTLRFAPPFIITAEEIDALITALNEIFITI